MSDESKTDTFGTILHDALSYINANNPDEVTLATGYEVEGTLDDVTVEVKAEVEVAGSTEYNYWETTLYDVEYEDYITVSMSLGTVIQTCVDECSTELVLANLLHIDRETVMAFCHFVAEQEQVQAALDSEEADAAATEEAGDAPDPDVSMTATELVEEAMDQRSIAQERADDAAAMPASAATRRALGLLTRGTKFWAFTNDYSLPFIYDERVPAETWGRGLTDDTEVWIEELAPAPEADAPAPEADEADTATTEKSRTTEKSLYSASSVRDLVGMLLADDELRPLLVGLLVEAGYAVGKKVV